MRRTLLGLLLAAAAAGGAGAAEPYPPSSYAAFGSSLGQSAQLGRLGWTPEQFQSFLDGLRAAYEGRPVPMDDTARRFADETGRRIAALASGPAAPPPAASAEAPQAPALDPERLARFWHDARRRLGLQLSDSGLGYNLQPGSNGVRPRPTDTVVFSCDVTGPDGAPLPQLAVRHGRARMDSLLPGLAEGLRMMTVGGRGLLVLPPALSFGNGPWPDGVSPGIPLVYRLTLEAAGP